MTFQQSFKSGEFVAGVWAQDQTMIAPDLVLKATHFGVATRVGPDSLTTADTGMFALGPQSSLDRHTRSELFSTWMTAATDAGVIPQNIVTIDLGEPSLTFGRVDLENAIGEPVYLPSISAAHWIVNMGFPQIALFGPVLVDTGMAYLSFPAAAMQILMGQIPGSKIDLTFDRLLLIPSGFVLKPFMIVIGAREFVLSSEQQYLNQPNLPEPPGYRYSIFHQMTNMPRGVAAVFGGKVHKHFIVILDDHKEQERLRPIEDEVSITAVDLRSTTLQLSCGSDDNLIPTQKPWPRSDMNVALFLAFVAVSVRAHRVDLRAVERFQGSPVIGDSHATALVYEDFHYEIDVGVGKIDDHWYTLVVDSGSYITFFGTNPKQPYIGSASQVKTTTGWRQNFISGHAYGGLWVRDQTMIAPDFVVGSTDFGVVTKVAQKDLTVTDTGVFALGPQAGLEMQVGSDRFSTWMTAATDAGAVAQNVVTVDLGRPSLTFGYADLENAVGVPVYVPCLEEESWLVQASIPEFAFSGPVSIDIGAPMFALEPADMQKMIKRIPGSRLQQESNMLIVPSKPLPKDLTIKIGAFTYVLSGQKQLLGDGTGRTADGSVFSIFQQIEGIESVSGAKAILGAKVLQHLVAAVLLTLVAGVYARKVSLRAVENFHGSPVTGDSRATSMVYEDFHYELDVGVGRIDDHWYTLFVDSGSYITFIGTNPKQPYIGSASQFKTTAAWQQTFVSGQSYAGVWARDQTMIAPDFVLGNTDFGIVTKVAQKDLTVTDTGVFALGPQAGLEVQVGSSRFSTWMTAATDAGVVPQNIVTVDLGDPSLTFGYVDLDHAVGSPVYVPCLLSELWLVKISIPQIAFTGPMLVDTGTPFVNLTPDDMQKLMKRIPGSKLYAGTNLLLVPTSPLPKDLTIQFGAFSFVLTGKKQILGEGTGRDRDGRVLSIFKQMPGVSGGASIIFGAKILQHLVVVLDDDNHRIGFAARREQVLSTCVVLPTYSASWGDNSILALQTAEMKAGVLLAIAADCYAHRINLRTVAPFSDSEVMRESHATSVVYDSVHHVIDVGQPYIGSAAQVKTKATWKQAFLSGGVFSGKWARDQVDGLRISTESGVVKKTSTGSVTTWHAGIFALGPQAGLKAQIGSDRFSTWMNQATSAGVVSSNIGNLEFALEGEKQLMGAATKRDWHCLVYTTFQQIEGMPQGTGAIMGSKVLQHLIIVLDDDKHRIGFAARKLASTRRLVASIVVTRVRVLATRCPAKSFYPSWHCDSPSCPQADEMRTAVLLTLVASASARKVSLRAVTNPRESNIVINSRATSLVYDDVHYVMDIGVGKYDVHWYTLLVDTGSEQTFFGTSPRQPYIGSASQSKTTATWTQAFVSGDYYSGLWARDQVDFGIVTKIAPGSATLLETGVFALAPQAGLEQKVGSDRFSTWMTAAADAGVVPQNIVTIDLGEPSLTFGHVDLENAVGTPVYLSCLEAERWLVKISMPDIEFDGPMLIDTGAPLFVLTTADMQKMIQRIPGSKILEGSRILQIPSDHIPMDLTFEIGNLKFVLPGEKQLLGAPTRRDFHGLVFSIFQQIDTMPDGAGAIMGSKVLQHLIALRITPSIASLLCQAVSKALPRRRHSALASLLILLALQTVEMKVGILSTLAAACYARKVNLRTVTPFRDSEVAVESRATRMVYDDVHYVMDIGRKLPDFFGTNPKQPYIGSASQIRSTATWTQGFLSGEAFSGFWARDQVGA
ncbi:hypothetical protein E5Q_04495 [Mixia osmundae IAM 14324]|uniref:Peptidase A1 domain-containing protein n=2 Tax=Mixia osmundae (strain CBS 9802 / IAM 14324 / JCM 22182 / KY 12970) TaxID=764103 RepID=G7E4Q6_MIXOS|nr:hypothetical protein E5Q_04495 [Mixia osmundae IAM 14324]